MSGLRRIGRGLLGEMTERARLLPRLRCTHALYASPRGARWMLTALQPGTYVRPHRHIDGSGLELLLVVAGDLGVIAFDEHAEIVASARPRPGGEDLGVEVPAGLFHTVVALAPDTVVLEVKEGLCPESGDKDFSPLFPEEGSPERGELLARWCALFTR